jgi:hypothetical protein
MMLRFQHASRVALVLLPLSASSLPGLAKDETAPPPMKPLRWLMTAGEMRNAGLALRIIAQENERVGDFAAPGPRYPNKCYFEPGYELALSDKKLAYFRARGFSLETLCLAITSPVHYDPETGKPVPVAVPAIVGNNNVNRKAISPNNRYSFMFVLTPPTASRTGRHASTAR